MLSRPPQSNSISTSFPYTPLFRSEFPAPPVEQEIACPPRRPRARDDRPGSAQPDIAERLDEYLHTRIDERGGDVRLPRIVDHQPHLFAAAAVVDGIGKRRDVAPSFIDRARPFFGEVRAIGRASCRERVCQYV